MSATCDFTLAELMIVAASEAWRGNGEVIASGLGVIPRLGASLAKLSHSPQLLMTDSEAYLVEEPIPLGPRGDHVPKYSGSLNFERVFECVWGGRRHAMIGPTQIDRWGQSNLSCVGDYHKPKAAMLGVRGFPGNSISHANSFLVPSHNQRVFVAGEVDVVASVGYNPARLARGWSLDEIDIRLIVTDLCVMDFQGPERQVRIRSLHPGVSAAEVQDKTGFALHIPDSIPTTAAPTAAQLALLAELDPHNLLPQNKGVLNNAADVDVFTFNAGAGNVSFTVTPAWDAFYRATTRRGANVDVGLELLDAAGNVIASNDPTTDTMATVSASVAGGTYGLRISGVGNATVPYSDYAGIGQYFINGTLDEYTPAAEAQLFKEYVGRSSFAVAEHIVRNGGKVALFDVNDDKGAEAVAAELGVGIVASVETSHDPRVVARPISGPALVNHHMLGCLERRRELRLIQAFLSLAPEQ